MAKALFGHVGGAASSSEYATSKPSLYGFRKRTTR